MARIRIVDEWLRSPVSSPSRHRAIMVVASSWSEQRVLMRAYAGSLDQTRPTIVLHGTELAIGPAGTDPHGEWGIHVEPPADGRAQELREQLELAARRLAGSKGNPPRLADEIPDFEKKPTNMWAPGTPRATPEATKTRVGYYEPADKAAPSPAAAAAPKAAPGDRTVMASSPEAPRRAKVITAAPTIVVGQRATPVSVPAAAQSANRGGGFRSTPAPFRPRNPPSGAVTVPEPPRGRAPRRRKGWTSPIPVRKAPVDGEGNRTRLGFEVGNGRIEGERTPGGPGGTGPRSLAGLVGRTMPIGFRLEDAEREVLNALGRSDGLTAAEVAEIVGVENGIQWMEELMTKLAEHGLDLIEPGDDRAGEPTYLLRR